MPPSIPSATCRPFYKAECTLFTAAFILSGQCRDLAFLVFTHTPEDTYEPAVIESLQGDRIFTLLLFGVFAHYVLKLGWYGSFYLLANKSDPRSGCPYVHAVDDARDRLDVGISDILLQLSQFLRTLNSKRSHRRTMDCQQGCRDANRRTRIWRKSSELLKSKWGPNTILNRTLVDEPLSSRWMVACFVANCVFAQVCVAMSVGWPTKSSIFPVDRFTFCATV